MTDFTDENNLREDENEISKEAPEVNCPELFDDCTHDLMGDYINNLNCAQQQWSCNDNKMDVRKVFAGYFKAPPAVTVPKEILGLEAALKAIEGRKDCKHAAELIKRAMRMLELENEIV